MERVKYAQIYVRCSKGTYIRSLARDIALECGSSAHLIALRRLSVGPFELKDAVGYDDLDDFSIENAVSKIENADSYTSFEKKDVDKAKIQMALLSITPKVAELCGFVPIALTKNGAKKFVNGNRLFLKDFESLENIDKNSIGKCALGVFYPNSQFAGIVDKDDKGFKYGFVVPPSDFLVFSWSEIGRASCRERV